MGILKYLVFGVVVSMILFFMRFFHTSGKFFELLKLGIRFSTLKVYLILYLMSIIDILFWPGEILAHILKPNEKISTN